MADEVRNVVIIGSGPAGYTAAIYTSRAMLKPLLVSGLQVGGQLMITTDIENFPGFPQGIQGPELMARMREQAERFGTGIIDDEVTKVDFKSRPFKIEIGMDEIIRARTVIIATGASARRLGMPSEETFWGHGVSACATCDGFFFRDKEIVVIGGGDSAMEEACFLTRFATMVRVVHRRDQLRASAIMQEKAFKNPKVQFIWNSVVEEILGDDDPRRVTGVRLRDVNTGGVTDVACDGVFTAVGHVPNTHLFKGQLALDEEGYIQTGPGGTTTSVEGVFAAGDVQDSHYRQATTAAGSGCKAAIDAERYLG
ncbi:thioredoxin-disulfide reductase [bacterium]|nr:thioredoxin-disulfide reductase [candidate division CSSED10-310 bacterium]